MPRPIRFTVAFTTIVLVITVMLMLAGAQAARALTPAVVPASPAQQAEAGRAIYEARCEVCHGAEGDGNGPAAENLDPKPRDFRRGWYKIRTTTSGQLPTDEDLVQVISNGMPGTSMPAWKGVLTIDEIGALSVYIKGFARRFERETPAQVEVGSKVASSPESIARGEDIFKGQAAECIKCHGNAGRGDGPSADELTDDFGNVIVPADLTMPWLFRGGATVDDIYWRLKTGLTGSPMPSYADVLSNEQMWDVANYVDSLGLDTPPELQPAIMAFRVQGAIPADANAPEWQNVKEVYYPLIGQIMREPRNYTPSIKGIWVRALHNDNELALQVRWPDRFQDAGTDDRPVDALAVQFPAGLPEGGERPYFVFGDSAHRVNLWMWSAATNPSTALRAGTVEERHASGAGTAAPQATQNAQGAAAFADGEYTLIVRRALSTGDAEDTPFEMGRFIPIAFMAWDGWRGEQDAAGAISSWQLIYLEAPAPVTNFIWIPVAVVATAALEWWIVRAVRRAAAPRELAGDSSTIEIAV